MKSLLFVIFLVLSACSSLNNKQNASNDRDVNLDIIKQDVVEKKVYNDFSDKTCSGNIWSPELVNNKQFISIGFDGSYNLEVWDETLDFAEKNDVKFTFYIVANHFISDDLRKMYEPPRYRKGRSDVGFGGTQEEVIQRLSKIVRAYKEGHAIASHANGHWDGSDWTKEEWDSELSQFEYMMRNAYEINKIEEHKPDNWEDIVDSIEGFRAPLLAHNKNMYKALAEKGYQYDTSYTGFYGRNPDVKENGIWGLPLVSIKTETGLTLAMDYNFLVKDKNVTPEEAEEKMYNTYLNFYKNNNSLDNKPPMQIGHHFSRWKEGAYWKALQGFVKDVCNKNDVMCGTNDYLAELLISKYKEKCSQIF